MTIESGKLAKIIAEALEIVTQEYIQARYDFDFTRAQVQYQYQRCILLAQFLYDQGYKDIEFPQPPPKQWGIVKSKRLEKERKASNEALSQEYSHQSSQNKQERN